MKLALLGLFLMLAIAGEVVYSHTGDPWAALGASGFAVASIALTVQTLGGYRGTKRR